MRHSETIRTIDLQISEALKNEEIAASVLNAAKERTSALRSVKEAIEKAAKAAKPRAAKAAKPVTGVARRSSPATDHVNSVMADVIVKARAQDKAANGPTHAAT
jgi:hypothetical protein